MSSGKVTGTQEQPQALSVSGIVEVAESVLATRR
jgi:hypothetical protein